MFIPNPTSDYFLIDAQEIAIENIELLNDIGQTIKNITYTGNIIRVDVAELPAGIYMLKFKNAIG
ncbi:MAG: T9SS type A sorting domain-containing protein [Chitinophagales bacterium]